MSARHVPMSPAPPLRSRCAHVYWELSVHANAAISAPKCTCLSLRHTMLCREKAGCTDWCRGEERGAGGTYMYATDWRFISDSSLQDSHATMPRHHICIRPCKAAHLCPLAFLCQQQMHIILCYVCLNDIDNSLLSMSPSKANFHFIQISCNAKRRPCHFSSIA